MADSLEPAGIALVTRGVVQVQFKEHYMEWEHDNTNLSYSINGSSSFQCSTFNTTGCGVALYICEAL